jgi:antitoxin ParD1/3/4
MAKNTSIALSDHFRDIIRNEVESGEFESASEVVRAGLRLLEERRTKKRQLEMAIQEGLGSGPALPFDFEDFLRRKRRKVSRRPRA